MQTNCFIWQMCSVCSKQARIRKRELGQNRYKIRTELGQKIGLFDPLYIKGKAFLSQCKYRSILDRREMRLWQMERHKWL